MESPEDRLRRLEAQNQDLRVRVERLEAALEQPPRWTPAPAPPEGSTTPAHGAESPPVSLEARIGTRWVAVAGAAVLLLGAVFFLQLAFDRGWIGPWARLALGWFGGAALWAGGEVLRRRLHEVYGQVLAAAGAAVVFAATWAAFGLDRYQALTGFSDPAGGVVLALVGLAVVGHGALVRGPVLAGTALALSHLVGAAVDDYQAVGMAGTAALAVALAAAAAWRRWTWLLISAQSLHITLSLHAAFAPDSQWVVLPAALLLATSVVAIQRQRSHASWPAGLAWLLAGWSLSAFIWERTRDWDNVGWLLLGLAILALASVRLPQGRGGAATAGILLAAVWPAVHFEEAWPATVWAIELAALAALAWRLPRLFTHIAASAFAAALAWWAVATGFAGVPVRTGWVIAFIAVCIAGIAAWVATRGHQRDRGRVALVAALLMPMAAVAAFRDDPVVTVLWAVEAAAALGAGAWLRDADVRFGGLGVIALVLVRIFVVDLGGVDPVIRVAAFIATGAILLGIGYAYARFLRRDETSAGP